MTSQADDVGALFKSIGADRNSYRELARNAEANDSEARWPLLKSIPPERREAPPALSSLHKNQVWNSQEKPAPREREAPRTFSGLGEKLARNLMTMTSVDLPYAAPHGSVMRASGGRSADPAPQAQLSQAPAARFEAVEPPRERRRNSAQFPAPSAVQTMPTETHERGAYASQPPAYQSRLAQPDPAAFARQPAPQLARAGDAGRAMFATQAPAQARPADAGRGMFGSPAEPQETRAVHAGRGLFASEGAPPARQGSTGLFSQAQPVHAPVRRQSDGRAGSTLQNLFRSLEGDNENPTPASGSRAAFLGRLNRR